MPERVYSTNDKPEANWIPQNYILKTTETKADLPTLGVPAGSFGYYGDMHALYQYDGTAWQTVFENS